MLFTEVPPSGLFTGQRVDAGELGELEEICHAARFLQHAVELLTAADDAQITVKLLAQLRDLSECELEAFSGAAHAAVVPHQGAKLAVIRLRRALTANGEQLFDARLDRGHGAPHLGVRFIHAARLHGSEVIGHRDRQHEVTVGQALHQGARAQAVRAVIGEVGFTAHEQAGDGALQVVVHPQAAHRVVDGGVHTHRHFVRVLTRDALVHLEQVVVTLGHGVAAQALHGLAEVEVNAAADARDFRAYAFALITHVLGAARGDVARDQVAEARVQALQVVIAVGFRNGLRILGAVSGVLRHPHAAVVT